MARHYLQNMLVVFYHLLDVLIGNVYGLRRGLANSILSVVLSAPLLADVLVGVSLVEVAAEFEELRTAGREELQRTV